MPPKNFFVFLLLSQHRKLFEFKALLLPFLTVDLINLHKKFRKSNETFNSQLEMQIAFLLIVLWNDFLWKKKKTDAILKQDSICLFVSLSHQAHISRSVSSLVTS